MVQGDTKKTVMWWCPWWYRSSRVWLSVSVFTIEVTHSPMGSELVDPSVDHWVDRKFTTSEPFFELQLSCMDWLQPKICLNYKCLFLRSPCHLEAQIWYTHRTLVPLGKSEKLKELINYFKSYSSLGDDRFFCPLIQVCLQRRGAHIEHIFVRQWNKEFL